MPLTTGYRVGSYEIVALLGAGGMGEVYRARDTKLGRQVALKVLSPSLAGDAQYMARFQREAKVLASLNHPNIAAIYGLEDNALVMELVEGQTLSGPLPVETALHYARQMTEALEFAHEKGVVHRDLKPANVKVTPDGVVKLLDFGLAKVAEETVTAGNPDDSPTLTMTLAATRMGTILGTAAYMAPEQARGQAVDKRADIWAFGVVLYEMVTGQRLFRGETVGDTLAQVLTKELNFDATPAQVRPVLRRCLERDRKKRLRDIGDAWDVAPEAVAPPVVVEQRRLWPWVAAAALSVIAALVLGFIHFREPGQPVLATSILAPEKSAFNEIAVSPDGKLLAFTATAEGKRQLWVRPLRSLSAQPLAGSEEAQYPFWSPDSRWIGFFAQGKLKKIEASGGPAQTLCDVAAGRGGTWNHDGVILYSDLAIGLYRVPSQGGAPRQVTVLDEARQETNHRWPVFLPGGRQYLYWIGSRNTNVAGIYLGALDTQERTRLVGDRSSPAYTSGSGGEGYLLFVRKGTLMAQPLDTGKGATAGEAFPVAEKVGMNDQLRASFSVSFPESGNGILVYDSSGAGGQGQLVWMDRKGKRVGTVGQQGAVRYPALSPDGRQVAVSLLDAQGQEDLWLHDLVRGIPTRFTFHPRTDSAPVWSPDGSRIVFHAAREGALNLYWKSASGAGKEEILLKSGNNKFPTDWSADGGSLLYVESDPKTKYDLWVLPLQGERKPLPFRKTEFNEWAGAFSPDGKWVAYTSDESGRAEIYVQPHPVTGAKRQLSSGGGTWPRWRRDGKELFWLELDGTMMAAGISMGQDLQAGIAAPLFESGISNQYERYSVSPDGQRFLLAMPVGETSGGAATVVQNWLAGARR
ncbi:MAG: PD40 domain-containing protein [Acidobacteriia bacterium]|nr:PD40 domain-containing protein [Terriglobia bacterium]